MALFLHIGYPKTSTTYLQNYYFNKLDLNFLGKKINHKSWLNSKKRWKYNEINKVIEQEQYLFIPKKKILISAESIIGNIWNRNFSKYNFINNLSKNKNLKIIITIRKQSNIFYSIYKQYLWEGGKKNFKNFYLDSISKKNEFDINYLDYYKLLKMINKKFNKKNILIFPSEMISKRYFNDFDKKITKFLGIKRKKIKYLNKLIRTGYSINEQFYIRFYNKILNKKLNQHENQLIFRPTFFKKVFNLKSYLLKFAHLETVLFKRKISELNKISYEIDNLFKKSNYKLSKEIGIDLKKFNYY